MIRVLVVGDGPRDWAMLPRLVETILAVDGKKPVVDAESRQWMRWHGGGRGYARKLYFAILQAIDAELAGLES